MENSKENSEVPEQPSSPEATLKRPAARRISPLLAVGLLGIALVGWGGIYMQQRRTAQITEHTSAALQHLRAGDSGRAETELRQVLALDANDLQALGSLAGLYLNAKRYPEALETYQRLAALEPDTYLLQVNIARAALGANNPTIAYKSTQEALKRDPDNIDALKLAVTISEMMGQKEERLKYLKRWKKLEPNNPEPVAKVADDYIIKSRYALARPLVEHLIKIAPDYSAGYSMRGHILTELQSTPGDLKRGEVDLLKALQLNPQDHISRFVLGKNYIRQRQFQQAIVQLEAVDRNGQSKNDPTYLLQLARAYQAIGNTQKAGEVRRRYLPLLDYQNKVWAYKSRLNVAPDDLESYVKLGLLLLHSEDPYGAERYINKAAELRPRDPQVRMALQQLEQVFSRNLQAGIKALQGGKYQDADRFISRAMLIRPHDPRTTLAVEQAREVTQRQTARNQAGQSPETSPLSYASTR